MTVDTMAAADVKTMMQNPKYTITVGPCGIHYRDRHLRACGPAC